MPLPNLRTSPLRWTVLWCAAILLCLMLMLRADFGHLRAVAGLSSQGSPAPAADATSPTGYVLGQRHFLGQHERGETYRWIAAAQQFLAAGPFAGKTYSADTVPTGRPQLLPTVYTGWLAAVATGVHLVSGEPLPVAVERAALWEPLIAHALVFAAAVIFMARRHGGASAAWMALIFVFFPPLFGQFLPGVLTARTGALFLAAGSIMLSLPQPGPARAGGACGAGAAVVAALALWLDPACGFPAVLLSAAAAATSVFAQKSPAPFLRWSLIGSVLTLAAWWIDRSPWAVNAGELRYVHPLYAAAWLGLGLVLDGAQPLRATGRWRKWRWAEVTAGALLLGALGYTQIHHAYPGWLYPSVWMRRLTSLDEGSSFVHAGSWLAQASPAEAGLIAIPLLAALAALAFVLRSGRTASPPAALPWAPTVAVLAGLLVLAFVRVRWIAVASFVAVPIVAHVAATEARRIRQTITAAAAVFAAGVLLWNQALPAAFQRPAGKIEPDALDLEALVNRHFSHWLASHSPGQSVSALAPPDLSDSIAFHGGERVLLSTAWESYPGQLAARRILSSLEWTEAEAVLQGHGITHVILPSWDKVLPLFVQTPLEPGKETLFARLQRWVLPPYLRPVPYRLPPLAAFEGQQLAVFQVTAPQDEPLLLSRLAEYFVEMERTEPADMVARVLAESYPDDPNAAIGRATVYAASDNRAGFERELARLAADAKAARTPFSWDRRVQRAIVLALGRQRELARTEVEACVATAAEADILTLTPLQAYRLATLARAHRLAFADPRLADLVRALGAEYAPRPPAP